MNVLTVHTLCKKAKCLSVGDYVIGSMSSRHSKSSLVLVQHSQGRITLAEVLYYLECTAICNSGECTKMWFAYVSTFLEHPCKLWYGHPVQVWTTVKSPQMLLVPVYRVKSRVVYVKCKGNFGRGLSSDTVYVVVPLSL